MKKLNNEIKEKAQLLNQWILQQDVVLEFKRYESLLKKNPQLRTLEEELKQLQKEIVQKKHQKLYCDDTIQEYQRKKQLFDENPIIHNYLLYKQEVNDLLYQIQNDIHTQLKKKID